MNRRMVFGGVLTVSACLTGGVLAWAQDKKDHEEYEHQVKESAVPPAALAALKKLAGGAAITEFAEEVEHGHKYYEGSWKGPNGNVDGLVSEAGDVVEIEETIPLDKVPPSVRMTLEKAAGKGTPLRVERKTLYVYEGHFKKDGKGLELQFTAEGRAFNEHGAFSDSHERHENGKESDEGDDDDDDDDDD